VAAANSPISAEHERSEADCLGSGAEGASAQPARAAKLKQKVITRICKPITAISKLRNGSKADIAV
jgi:hypothetical protein